MKRTIAIIDLGTNTFHLLIAAISGRAYTLLHQERAAVKLGMAGINQGIITDEACHRALETIGLFKLTIDRWQDAVVYAFGTSAWRNARNAMELVDKIRQQTGIEIKIISGEEEARLIYLGVRSAVNLGKSKSLIMDIGGGSVEFVIGNESEIFWKQSIEVGAQRLLEQFQKHDPIWISEVGAIEVHLKAALAPLFSMLKVHAPDTLIGASGTFDTLSEIYCLRYGLSSAPTDTEGPLTISGMEEIFMEVVAKNRSSRMAIPGMTALRVDMIVVACCMIFYLLKKHDFKNLRVSKYALKEGVLAECLAAN